MHWTRGCKEIIPTIDADTTSLIHDQDDTNQQDDLDDDDGDDDDDEGRGLEMIRNNKGDYCAKHARANFYVDFYVDFL